MTIESEIYHERKAKEFLDSVRKAMDELEPEELEIVKVWLRTHDIRMLDRAEKEALGVAALARQQQQNQRNALAAQFEKQVRDSAELSRATAMSMFGGLFR